MLAESGDVFVAVHKLDVVLSDLCSHLLAYLKQAMQLTLAQMVLCAKLVQGVVALGGAQAAQRRKRLRGHQ